MALENYDQALNDVTNVVKLKPQWIKVGFLSIV